MRFASVDDVERALRKGEYLPDRGLATAVFLALEMERPLLLEGEAGVGTISAAHPPVVVVTSNRTRELHDALKRRCLYHWIDFPDLEREVEIITLRAPGVSEQLAWSVAEAVARLRELDPVKRPGMEAIDWVRGLALLGADGVAGQPGRDTLG